MKEQIGKHYKWRDNPISGRGKTVICSKEDCPICKLIKDSKEKVGKK